jgi:hypothetical protein
LANQASHLLSREQYYEGNQNNFIYVLAFSCNKKGIPENETLKLISSILDPSDKEIISSVRSAYLHHVAGFANFANFAVLQNENKQMTKVHSKVAV